MAGDNAVRSLLEKMTQCASSAYLGILERYLLMQTLLLDFTFMVSALMDLCCASLVLTFLVLI